VKSSILVLSISSILLFSFFFFACKKINEGTELGDDLLPVVDNVTTFDTFLTVQTFNDAFTDLTDSTRISYSAEHFLGHIENDQLFGKTNASLFLQLKPGGFPFSFNSPTDSITSMAIDSVVLVLSYADTYGDTNAFQNLQVFEIDQSSDFKADSIDASFSQLIARYQVRNNNITPSTNLLSSASIQPRTLDDSLYLFREQAKNQLRLKLSPIFGQRLLTYDTATVYKTDSAFTANFKGFAIIPDAVAGNAIMGFSLADTNTKLAIYYKGNKNNIPGQDTSLVRYFRFNPVTCGHADLVKRIYAGYPITNSLSDAIQDSLVYIQNTPGSFATIKIPALSNLGNRVVHRAELIVEQVHDPSDDVFGPPDYLYLDAYDSAKANFRTIPFDFGIDFSGGINAGSFGMVGKPAIFGPNTITVWRFNLTRYVQHIVTNHNTNYSLRLSSPNYIKEIYSGNETTQQFSVNPTIAKGRLRVGGGNHSTQRMRLRIIYSKI